MKSIKNYINEALQNEDWLSNAKNNEEPFVKAALENEGWKIKVGSQDEDFKGIDLKVEKDDTDDQFGGKFNIDVKGCSAKNKNSKRFLFTCKSSSGKEYPYKDKHFIAFINYTDKTITIVADNDIKTLASKYKEYDSQSGDNSKFILLPKMEVQKLGRTIDPSDEIKSLLK
jgi:hypothetical protein